MGKKRSMNEFLALNLIGWVKHQVKDTAVLILSTVRLKTTRGHRTGKKTF